jgi:hypothetical protein
LLKSCLAIPKLLYTLRTSAAFESNLLSEYDILLRQGLEKITNCHIQEASWLQATLPVHLGGLGIRSARQIALPAFLSSVHGTSNYMQQIIPLYCNDLDKTRAVDAFTFKAALPKELDTQKAWDNALLEQDRCFLDVIAFDDRQKARLHAAYACHSGAWLNAIPNTRLGLKLNDFQLRIAVALRLGIQMCHPHKCLSCEYNVDSYGTHGLTCKKSAGRYSRHFQVNDIIKRALCAAQIPSTLEPLGLFRDDGKRPDGLTMIPWHSGRCLVWDFTCPDTLAASHLHATKANGSAAANKAESAKQLKYKRISDSYVFQPVAVETLGAWGSSGLQFIQAVGTKLAKFTGEKKSTSYLIQAISVAIQRGNATSIMGAIPAPAKLDEIFYI